MYSGRQSKPDRDEVRKAFMREEFQIIVITDADNEGIDLQAAHMLVNYDIPWSLVRPRCHRLNTTAVRCARSESAALTCSSSALGCKEFELRVIRITKDDGRAQY
jgi:superfamily II DNA/RNA helicase